ncbi:MAG: hypothetical protein ACHREM_02305 [Polyangiales bacterium]
MKPLNKAALVVLVLASLFIGAARCDEEKPKESSSTPSCCAIPRKWCHLVFVCNEGGVHYCTEWEWQDRCVDLCDHWESAPPAPSSSVCPNATYARDPGPPPKPSVVPPVIDTPR